MKTNRILIISFIVGLLLLIPFTVMQVSKEVVWSTFDFLVAGILLMVTGLAIKLVWRKFISTKRRILFCGILGALFVIWAELGVGILGTSLAGN